MSGSRKKLEKYSKATRELGKPCGTGNVVSRELRIKQEQSDVVTPLRSHLYGIFAFDVCDHLDQTILVGSSSFFGSLSTLR